MEESPRLTHITVSIGNEIASKKESISCVVGRDIKISDRYLVNYCRRQLERSDLDLLVVASSVAFADRTAVRRHHIGWSRSFCLQIPVFAHSLWRSSNVLNPLRDCLFFLTGDSWNFEFVPRQDRKPSQLNLLSHIKGRAEVIPFSGGLDSFVAAKSYLHENPDERPILASVTNAQSKRFVEGCAPILGTRAYPLRFPISFRNLYHPEPSYRTRAFLFFSLAALAAKLADSNSVIIGENGQGALGPSLIPCGPEQSHTSTHPAFTARLANFLTSLGWARPAFSHPNIWRTKGEALAGLALQCGLNGIELTVSCSRDTDRAKGRGVPLHCGVCPNCLLRRLALYAAGVTEFKESYLWQDLSSSELEMQEVPGSRPMTPTDARVASQAVFEHRDLAAVDVGYIGSRRPYVIREIAQGLAADESTVTTQLRRLLIRHREEWNSFLKQAGADSWIARLCKGGADDCS